MHGRDVYASRAKYTIPPEKKIKEFAERYSSVIVKKVSSKELLKDISNGIPGTLTGLAPHRKLSPTAAA
jgi:hypothetical protein